MPPFHGLAKKKGRKVTASSASRFPPTMIITPQADSAQSSKAAKHNDAVGAHFSLPHLVHDTGKGKDHKDWTIENIVGWLKTNEFDQDICDKFSSACRQLILLTVMQTTIYIRL